MPEIDKLICFNAFHVLFILMICNLIVTNNWEYIINSIYYILNLETPGFWFLVLHSSIAYIILTNLKIELGFRASIKFINL
jgi:hypothetical protein